MRNHEVKNTQNLLNKDGNIAEPGWARSQVWQYSRSAIKAPKFRIKEWDYYLVTSRSPDGDFAIAFTISDDGYIGLQSISLLELGKNPWEHTETILNVFPMGKFNLPPSSSDGDVVYKDKRLDLKFELKKNPDGKTIERHIAGTFKNFYQKKDFSCDILLSQPNMDTMVIATPWDKKAHFYYNQKINCMRASGWAEFDGKRYEFNPKTDFGTLDWGRGVWTYDNTWKWGSGNCDIDGHSFGFNIGYGFGNTKAATENIIFYDGVAHKLDDVEFCIPQKDGKDDYMSPWKFTSSDGRFEMDFLPILDRCANLDFKVLVSDQHQIFGKMSGKAILDDGKVINVKNLLCFAEKVHNRY
ncbi:MAG: DUF2804 domain-containing protein [Treponemataceae bacterium]|nr:DUF2804 domain-containing protein [Spirochaetales bacterium]MDY6030750.1 DUF2804 domain-containing protein [Treponemataceae bacterium]